jgi:hypothetical protein
MYLKVLSTHIKVHNLIHFTLFALKCSRIFPAHDFQSRGVQRTISKFQNHGVIIYVLCFVFNDTQLDSSRKSEKKNKLIFNALLIFTSVFRNKIARRLFLLAKWRLPVLKSFESGMTAISFSTHTCRESFSLMNNNQKRNPYLVSWMDTLNLSWQWFPVISHRGQKSSPGPNKATSQGNLHGSWAISSVVMFVA